MTLVAFVWNVCLAATKNRHKGKWLNWLNYYWLQARNRKGAAAGANGGGGLGTGSNSSSAQKSNASSNARKKDSSSSTGTPSINGSNTSGGGGGGGGASINNSKSMNQLKSQFLVMTPTHMFLGCCCLLIASYFCYIGYLETRVNTPFDDNKVSSGFCFTMRRIIFSISVQCSTDGATHWTWWSRTFLGHLSTG